MNGATFLIRLLPTCYLSSLPRLKQTAGGLEGVDIRAAQGVRLQVERGRPLPHVHQHLAVRRREAPLALRDHRRP